MRPSTGCVTCIKRKVKCDEERPICRRCTKANRDCRGYRIPKKPAENVSIITRNAAPALVAPFGESDIVSPDSIVACAPSFAGDVYLDPQSLETRALCCFFEHFVWVKKPFGFFLDYLPCLYFESAPDSGLATIARAVSFAFLANKTQDHRIEHNARKQYGNALASVNQCLGSTTSPVNDQTMLSMLLLILFENFNVTQASPDKFLNAWVAHLGGSSLAVRHRGPGQLKTEVGRAMFQIQVVKMIIYAMLQGEPIPKFAETWTRQSRNDPDDIGVQLLSTVRQTSIMFKKAKILINSVSEMDASSPKSCFYMQQFDDLSDHVEAMVKHDLCYENLLAASQAQAGSGSEEAAWVESNLSTYYACRLIHSRIIEICARRLARSSRQSQNSTMDPLRVMEIVDFAKYVQGGMLRSIIRFVTTSTNLKTRFPEPPVAAEVSSLACFLNLWPVFAALHGTPESTPEQKQWFRLVLEHFAYNEGLWIANTFSSQPYAAVDDLTAAAGV